MGVLGELEAAAKHHRAHSIYGGDINLAMEESFKAGATWQREQMETNRLKHCDNITEEQYDLECRFLDDFLAKNNRMPTYLDAIEYGKNKKPDLSGLENSIIVGGKVYQLVDDPGGEGHKCRRCAFNGGVCDFYGFPVCSLIFDNTDKKIFKTITNF